MTLTLRPYQAQCLDAHWQYFQEHLGNPLFVVPTGGGKSLIMAEFLRASVEAWPKTKALVVTHVKELIQQNFGTYVKQAGALCSAGIYSAGVGRRDTTDSVIFAGVQSIYQRAEEFGHVDLMLVDEVHLLPKSGEGRYLTLIAGLKEINPKLRVVGYTATPYRLNGGFLHKGEGRILTDIAYEITIDELVGGGYLSKLSAKAPKQGQIDTKGIARVNGDFKKDELSKAAMASDLEAACSEMVRIAQEQGRKHWLIFACSVDHALAVQAKLEGMGVECASIFGSTPKAEREKIVEDYKAKRLNCLVNVGVLTTGFDAPHVDLLVLMRATQSTGLYVQIMGRAMRVAEGKTDALVLDYGGNIERHGPVNDVDPVISGSKEAKLVKVCPSCDEINALDADVCACCGFPFPKNERSVSHDSEASELEPMRLGRPPIRTWVDKVDYVYYERHEKEGKPDSFKVTYACGYLYHTEYICLEHGGYARKKAVRWWGERGNLPVPETVTEALRRKDELREPYEIHLIKDGKYDRVSGAKFRSKEESDGDVEGVPGERTESTPIDEWATKAPPGWG